LAPLVIMFLRLTCAKHVITISARDLSWISHANSVTKLMLSLYVTSRPKFNGSASPVLCNTAPSLKRNKIVSTAMAALHLNASRPCQGRIQTNLVVVPAANSKQFEKFCELNKRTCPLLYHSKPGDVTAANLAIDTDIRYVELAVNTFDSLIFCGTVCRNARCNIPFS